MRWGTARPSAAPCPHLGFSVPERRRQKKEGDVFWLENSTALVYYERALFVGAGRKSFHPILCSARPTGSRSPSETCRRRARSKSDEVALIHRPPLPPLKSPTASPHRHPQCRWHCQGPHGVSASSGSPATRGPWIAQVGRPGSAQGCVRSTQGPPAHAGQIRHGAGRCRVAGPSGAGPGAGGAAEGWHPAPAIICIPQLSNVGLGAATATACGGEGAGSAVGQDTASCPRPSPIGFTPEPPATSTGLPTAGCSLMECPPSRKRLLGKAGPGSEAVGTCEAGNISAGRAGSLAPLPGSPRSPSAGPGGTRVRPPPRLSHHSHRNQREEAALRRVDSNEPEESKQYPLSSAFPWQREGAEEP